MLQLSDLVSQTITDRLELPIDSFLQRQSKGWRRKEREEGERGRREDQRREGRDGIEGGTEKGETEKGRTDEGGTEKGGMEKEGESETKEGSINGTHTFSLRAASASWSFLVRSSLSLKASVNLLWRSSAASLEMRA